MCKTECPQTQVGGGVGNPTENKLDGVNDLMDKYFSKVEFLLLIRILGIKAEFI